VLNGKEGCDSTIDNLALINKNLKDVNDSLPLGKKIDLKAVSIIPYGEDRNARSALLDDVYRRALSKGIPASVRCCRGEGAGQHFFLLRDIIYKNQSKEPDDDDIILIADSTCGRGNALTRKQYLEYEQCGRTSKCNDGYRVNADVVMYWLEKIK
jgi:hypothetical protein